MKRNLLILATSILFSAGLATEAAESLEIIKDGRSSYRIVIASQATRATKKAAEEFRHYLEKSTGVNLPLTQSDTVGDQPSIVIGAGPAAEEVGIYAERLPLEGFLVKTVGKNLYIAGDDTPGAPTSVHWAEAPRTGTWYGVCDFLESHLGIRWFSPGEHGEHVPLNKVVSIPPLNYSDHPQMSLRKCSFWWGDFHDYPQRKVYNEWLRRNRYGSASVWCSWHTWINDFKANDYFDDHPEWFALVDGVRRKERSLGAQMCVTSPGALDQFSRVIVEKRQNRPGVMFSLTPNDGDGHCECDKCQMLDNGVREDGSRIMTDRYVYYCNEVAQRVKRKLPEQRFGFLAYSFYSDPPEKFQVDSSVSVMLVGNCIQLEYRKSSAAQEELEKHLLPWKSSRGTLYFDSYTVGNGLLNLPSMHPGVIKMTMKNLVEANVNGATFWNFAPPMAAGLDNYLYFQLMWRPERDFDSLYADALEKCYGVKAAPIIKTYFAKIEAIGDSAAELTSKERAIGTLKCDCYIPFFAGQYKMLGRSLEKALALTDTADQGHRIQALLDDLRYADLTAELFVLGQELTEGSNITPSRLAKAIRVAEERLVLMQELDKKYWFNLKRVLKNEKYYRLPLSPKIFKTMYAATQKPAVADVPLLAKAPLINGKCDSDEWEQATLLTIDRQNVDGDEATVKTEVRLGRDHENLYICFICSEPRVTELNDVIVERDGNVWLDNEIEIFLAPNGSDNDYFQLLCNTLGTLCDFRCTAAGASDRKWDSNAEVSACIQGDRWIAEFAIPLSAFGQATVSLGTIWKANFCRSRKIDQTSELTAWNQTFGSFHRPARFGRIVFRD